jgi:TRAP-type C4-dicarboxylate transport system permease large subunit
MPTELILLLIMLFIFSTGVFWLKLPSGVSLGLAAVIGAIIGGEGIPVRHLVEGSFGFLDAMMIIASAMVFMKVIESTGALATISTALVKYFHKWPTLLIILIVFFVMFPGMFTGISSTCILTTGALVAPALLAMGMPKKAAGSLIAMAAIYGMVAPPINIPVMIICGGVDMPYIGFEKPLIFATFPLAIFTAIYFRVRFIRKFNVKEVLAKLPSSVYPQYGIRLFVPIIFVIGALISIKLFPRTIPDIGIPLIFIIGAILGFGSGHKFNFYKVSRVAIRDIIPVLGILVGVGMFVQIMTLLGIRGFLAVSAIKLPLVYLYIAIALFMPAFGSAFASSSVLGVPLIFVFLGTNEIIVCAALSLIAAVGDLMPPPSLLTVFSAQIVGEENHFRILKQSIIPIIVTLIYGIMMIVFAVRIGDFLK